MGVTMRADVRSLSVLLAVCLALASGCSLAGGEHAPTVAKAWVLVSNLRYTGEGSEPQYVWVPEDEIPTSLTTVLFGKKAVIAPLHVVPRYAPPPGNGVISPLQGGKPQG
jgi:hypothetical protein